MRHEYYKFYMHIPKYYAKDFEFFKQTLGRGNIARTICILVKDFNDKNIRLHIPTIRLLLEKNPKEIRKLKELLKEFE